MRSLRSLGTTCHTVSWFIYLLFAYDVCVWRINLTDKLEVGERRHPTFCYTLTTA